MDHSITMGRSQSVPPMASPGSIYNPGPRVDARGNPKKINPAIVSKYAELIFQKHLDNASSDDVRLLYAQANDNKSPLPGMKQFVGQQGVDLVELETDMASTYEPYPGPEYSGNGGAEMERMELHDQGDAYAKHVQQQQAISPYGLASVREEPGIEEKLPPPAVSAGAEEGEGRMVVSETPEPDQGALGQVTVSSEAAVTAVTL